MRPAEQIDACRTSQRRLLADLAPLSDSDFRMPSLLPRYSRAHLVTHITNKARAHIELFEGAAIGERRRLHPAGYDPDEAASAGAGRSATQLRADLTSSFELLEAAWARCGDDTWGQQALMTAGPRTMIEVLAHHQRNVEVHHVDLDLGYRACDWPMEFVETELTKRLRALPDRANHPDLFAWLLDRGPAPVLVGPW